MMDSEFYTYKQQRAASIQRIESKRRADADFLKNICNYFNSDDPCTTLITIKELSLIPIGKRVAVNDKVFFTRQPDTMDGRMFFITEVLPGGKFGRQNHDIREVCEIIKGHLIETYRNHIEYKENDAVVYGPMEIHKPYSELHSLYHVYFDYKNMNLTSAT